MPQAGLLGTIHWTDGTEELRDFDGPMVLVPEQAIQWLRDKLPNPIDRSDAQRKDARKRFYELVREGIVNALVHRNYDITGAKCQLVITPDTIVIKSPREPIPPITLQQLQEFNAPMLSRNPILHYVFAKMALAEERGLGLKSMKTRASDIGLPLPKYTWEDPYLVLTLYRSAKGAVRALGTEVLERLGADEKAALQTILANQPVTTAEVMAETGFDERKTQRVLRKLIDAGLVRRVGKGRATQYSAISPDGKLIAHTVKRARYDDNAYDTHLFMTTVADGATRQLTFGEHADSCPAWSPDGRTLAFISNRKDKKQQIYLLSLDGGEARPLTTDLDGYLGELSWSPDGSRLAFTYRKLSDEQIARREAEKAGNQAKREAFKVFSSIHFKEDGLGYRFDTRQHVFTVSLKDGAVTQLTDGDADDHAPVFSPDGKTIAFSSNRHPEGIFAIDNEDLFLVPAEGGAMQQIDTYYGPSLSPAFSPDGKTLAFVGCPEINRGNTFWQDQYVWSVPVAGGKPVNLTPGLKTTVGNMTVTDTSDVGDVPSAPIWSPDGTWLYFLVSEQGSVRAARVSAKGGEVEMLTPPGAVVSAQSADAQTGRLALLVSTHTRPAEIAVLQTAEPGEPRFLSRHNDALRDDHWIGEPEEIHVESEPGVTVHGWILKPPGFDPKKRYPAILEIHGGPHAQYACTFFHEMQYLAGLGYVVLWTNPRGSQGYGQDFAGSIVQDWGGPDYRDVMACVDHLVAQDYVDPARLGVTGGSYGGYMTNWIVGHTDRFKAAVTQRSVVNLYSFYGESDFGFAFEWEFFGRPWNAETALKYHKMSPLSYVENINTPLLIIHSEEDHRCPISQAEELFSALMGLQKQAPMVQFERDSHTLSRGGRPKNRLERLKRIAGWFETHLKGDA